VRAVAALGRATYMPIELKDWYKAWNIYRTGNMHSEAVAQFAMSKDSNLIGLWQDVNNRTYKVGKSRFFIVTRPRKREIVEPAVRDRIAQTLVIMKLESLVEERLIEDSYNCRKGKGVLHGIERVSQMIREASHGYTEDVWVLTFDIKSFFWSLDISVLWKKWEEVLEGYRGKDKDDIYWLMRLFVWYRAEDNAILISPKKSWADFPPDKSLFNTGGTHGMAPGSVISQWSGNLMLADFGRVMRDKYGYFANFMDDGIVIGSKGKCLDAICFARKELRKIGLLLHPKKVYIQPYYHGVKWTGAVIKKSRTYISNSTVGNCYKMLECDDDDKMFQCRINSYLGMMMHFNSYNIKRKIARRIPAERWDNIYMTNHLNSVKLKKKRI